MSNTNSVESNAQTTGPAPSAVPDPISVLRAIDPDFYDGYYGAREAVMRPREDGLNQREKELVLLTVDVVRGNVEAGTFHALKAMENGASLRGVLDAILLSFLVGGAATWGMTGIHIYQNCVEAVAPRTQGLDA